MGTNNISSHGAFQDAPDIGGYSIRMNLVLAGNANPPVPATRNYVVTGAVAYPAAGYSAVEYIGSYAADTGGDKTSSTSGVTGSIDEDWTCQESSATANNQMARAGKADTLLYGFSSWPQAGATPDNVYLTLGVQPFRRIKTRSSNTLDNVYSQIHMTYNVGYYPLDSGGGVVTGGTNGANFTGAVGAVVTGRIDNGTPGVSGTTLTVTSNSGGGRYGQLRDGDRITGTGVTANTQIVGSCNAPSPNPTYTCTVNISQTVASTTITATSNILLASAPTSGCLTAGDTITTGITGTPTILPFSTSGTTGTGCVAGDYVLSSHSGPVNSTSMQSTGSTITVPNTSVKIPVAGTAMAVSQGTGVMPGTVFTGAINAGNLTSTTSVTLCEGDALFGGGYRVDGTTTEIGIKPKTTISGPSGCTTGTSGWTVSGTTDAPSGTIVARTAVLASPAPTATSFKLSRVPTTRLSSSAVVCGGVCALFYNASNVMNTNFTLSGVTSGDDWASGFACMSGVDSANIDTIGLQIRKMAGWKEVVAQ